MIIRIVSCKNKLNNKTPGKFVPTQSVHDVVPNRGDISEFYWHKDVDDNCLGEFKTFLADFSKKSDNEKENMIVKVQINDAPETFYSSNWSENLYAKNLKQNYTKNSVRWAIDQEVNLFMHIFSKTPVNPDNYLIFSLGFAEYAMQYGFSKDMDVYFKSGQLLANDRRALTDHQRQYLCHYHRWIEIVEPKYEFFIWPLIWQSHYCLTFASVKEKTIYYYNPYQLTARSDRERRMTEDLRDYFDRLMPTIGFKDFRITRFLKSNLPLEERQNDGHNCGFFVLAKALSIVQSGTTTCRVLSSDLKDFREMLGALLFSYCTERVA